MDERMVEHTDVLSPYKWTARQTGGLCGGLRSPITVLSLISAPGAFEIRIEYLPFLGSSPEGGDVL